MPDWNGKNQATDDFTSINEYNHHVCFQADYMFGFVLLY